MEYHLKELLKPIALENNMTIEEVYEEIEILIAEAYTNENPIIRLLLDDIPHKGVRPTPEEVIVALAGEIIHPKTTQ